MAAPLKDKRIELRVTAAQKETVEAAAALEGRTVSEFSSDALLERAQDVIRRERQLRVEAEHLDEFLTILDRPARGLDGLRDLLARPSVFVD